MTDEEKKTYDWRVFAHFTGILNLPPAYPGGPARGEKTEGFVISLSKTAQGDVIEFIRPRPAAMTINIAIKNALCAHSLKQALVLNPIDTHVGKGMGIKDDNIPRLYDYFENSMVSVTFSIQSLETYCNEIIEMHTKGTIPIKKDPNKNKIKHLNKEQLQNDLSLKRKIGEALPKILSLESPENLTDKKIWDQYLELERVRITTVHLKSIDENPLSDMDKESLFFEFFRTDVRNYPKYALDIMEYFKLKINDPDWIEEAKNFLNS